MSRKFVLLFSVPSDPDEYQVRVVSVLGWKDAVDASSRILIDELPSGSLLVSITSKL